MRQDGIQIGGVGAGKVEQVKRKPEEEEKTVSQYASNLIKNIGNFLNGSMSAEGEQSTTFRADSGQSTNTLA